MVGERIILISTLLLWPQLLGYGALIGSFKDDKYLSPFIMIASSANCLMARLLSSDESLRRGDKVHVIVTHSSSYISMQG